MDKNNHVLNDEELYRNVRSKPEIKDYHYDDTGKLRILPRAFFDPAKKPSVDRAKLIGHNPYRALKDETHGIVSLMAGDVRSIRGVTTKGKTDDEVQIYTVDVEFNPTLERPAHSLISVIPEFRHTESQQKKAFKQLRLALARLASENGWKLKPECE